MRFEWDRAKASANLEKHRVTIDEPLPCSAIPWQPRSMIQSTLVASGASSPSATRRKGVFLWYVMSNGDMQCG